MIHSAFLPRWLKAMLTNYQDWQKKRNEGVRGKGKDRARPAEGRPQIIPKESQGGASGVLSYNQMKRMSAGGSIRAPSEVGSIRSFRSVQTIEEQVSQLEDRVQGLADNQKEIDTKLDQILLLLSQTKKERDISK